ncbi:MAG: AsmA family protein [Coraliomargarita sp.]
MIKKLLSLFGILIIAAIVVIYLFGSSFIAKTVKAGVEKIGPQVTQTSVVLNDVDLSILSGNVSLQGLYIGNPDGYKSEHIFALGQIDIDMSPASIFSDTIVINKIHIKQPEMSYEKTLTSSNVKELQKHIETFTKQDDTVEEADTPETAPDATGASKQVVIRELIVEDCKVFVGLMGSGAEVVIPEIVVNDIGDGGGDKAIADAINIVLTEVLKAVTQAVAEEGEGGLQGAMDGVKGLFGK